MKKYLLNTLLFAIVCLIFAFALDTVLSTRLRQNQNRIFANWNQIYNDTTDYDLVINGNSRAQMHISPFILDSILHINSYNLGMHGKTINTQFVKYKKYCKLHEIPKFLVQNIDLWTLEFNNGYEREQFFPYFFYDRDLITEINQYENFTFIERFCPCYRYLGYEEVINEALFFANQKYYCDFTSSKGYQGKDLKWDGSELSKIESLKCSLDSNAIKLFEDYLISVMFEGTKVIFVYAPIYFEARQKMVNEKQMFEIYDSIARRFDIPILDYNDIPMCYDTTYFYNATHLNRIGAELFTTKLAHDIDSLGLLK